MCFDFPFVPRLSDYHNHQITMKRCITGNKTKANLSFISQKTFQLKFNQKHSDTIFQKRGSLALRPMCSLSRA